MPLSISKTAIAIRLTTASTALVLGLGASTAASADQPESSAWGLGVGAVSSQQPYKGIDRDSEVLPLIYFENEYLRVFGPTAEIKLPGLEISDTQQLDFSLVGEYDFSGYDDDDARILEGMSDRKGGFWAGAKVKWRNDLADVSAEWLGDVSGNSKGQRFTLGLERSWRIGEHIMLTPRLAAIWQDEKYVDYYFGVRENEARIDRAAYDGKSGINTEFGVRGNYMFDDHHSVFLDLKATSLANEIKDSPLVDQSTENSVLFGYLYRF
ncbi:MipA/OmpV family protein [Pseudomonas sp. FP198]|uniref:MipA/OmpV family protein n=1 Tax=Pseudomonas sp. FP198 TaxID=2954084 RepID=UPI0027333E52|nr:MipA/OmpV family protein [Pseudomonas sp. FP198]WLG93461.1 MipA/OmpV family protein [Pseudomonas sp. FP198]